MDKEKQYVMRREREGKYRSWIFFLIFCCSSNLLVRWFRLHSCAFGVGPLFGAHPKTEAIIFVSLHLRGRKLPVFFFFLFFLLLLSFSINLAAASRPRQAPPTRSFSEKSQTTNFKCGGLSHLARDRLWRSDGKNRSSRVRPTVSC